MADFLCTIKSLIIRDKPYFIWIQTYVRPIGKYEPSNVVNQYVILYDSSK